MKKNTIILFLSMFVILSVFIYGNSVKYNTSTVYYTHVGQMTVPYTKIVCDTITPTTGTAFSIDISSTGFSSINDVQLTIQNNTATVANMPSISIKSISNTTLVVNILVPNTSLVTVLGLNVLSGAGLIAPTSTAGMVIHYHITGN